MCFVRLAGLSKSCAMVCTTTAPSEMPGLREMVILSNILHPANCWNRFYRNKRLKSKNFSEKSLWIGLIIYWISSTSNFWRIFIKNSALGKWKYFLIRNWEQKLPVSLANGLCLPLCFEFHNAKRLSQGKPKRIEIETYLFVEIFLPIKERPFTLFVIGDWSKASF